MEMIVADKVSVIGILADLKNTRNNFWLDMKKVMSTN